MWKDYGMKLHTKNVMYKTNTNLQDILESVHSLYDFLWICYYLYLPNALDNTYAKCILRMWSKVLCC